MPASFVDDGCTHIDTVADGERIVGTRCVCSGAGLCNGGTAVSVAAPTTTPAPIVRCYECDSETDSGCGSERKQYAPTCAGVACTTFVGSLNGKRREKRTRFDFS